MRGKETDLKESFSEPESAPSNPVLKPRRATAGDEQLCRELAIEYNRQDVNVGGDFVFGIRIGYVGLVGWNW